MDFMRLLKSIEELLYELVSWLFFYPLTVGRILVRPLAMLGYAEKELSDKPEEQYDDALSPPVVLLITLVLMHAVEGTIAGPSEPALSGLLADEWNLLVFRAVAFSLFPLLFAVVRLRVSGARITRRTLRPPFYSQCYATAPFVVAFSLALNLLLYRNMVALGLAILVAGTAWYFVVQVLWLTTDGRMTPLRGVLTAAITLVGGVLLLFLFTGLVGQALL